MSQENIAAAQSLHDSKHFKNVDYDRIDDHPNFMAPIFDDMLASNTYNIVLDVGCGNGYFTAYLKSKIECFLTGIDSSEYALKLARDRGFTATHIVNDLDRDVLPLQNKSTDLIICKDLLEHLLKPDFVLKESHRVLNDQGHLLVLVPNHFPLFYRLKFLFDGNIDTAHFFPDSHEWDFPHIRFFTMAGLTELLKFCGFEIIKDYNINFPLVPGASKLPFGRQVARYLVKKNPTQWATAFTLLCRKISKP